MDLCAPGLSTDAPYPQMSLPRPPNIAPPQAGNLQTSQTRDSSSRFYVVILPLFGKLLIILQSPPHYHLLFSVKDCVGVL